MSAKTKTKPTANGEAVAPLSPLDVLTLDQAAAYLQLAEEVVRQEAERGRLPGRKVGADWRFSRLAITEWLAGPPEPKPKSSKERIRALIGVWKDDLTVDAMVEEIYRLRKANPVGGR
jgi:excisionase family DNA binding protein